MDNYTMAGMAIVGFTVYEYSQRGQKKSWRLPFWESIGVVDIIVFPILLIVCMPFVFNQYSTVKKVFSIQQNKPYMQHLKTALGYIGMEEDFDGFFDRYNYTIKYSTDDVLIFGILIASLGFLNYLSFPNKLLDEPEYESEDDSDDDDDDDDDDEPTPKKVKKEKKATKVKKVKKAVPLDPAAQAKAEADAAAAAHQKRVAASKVVRKMDKDYYNDRKQVTGC
jgi:hypothetical protein